MQGTTAKFQASAFRRVGPRQDGHSAVNHLVRAHKDKEEDDGDIGGSRAQVGNLAGDANDKRAGKHAAHAQQQQGPPPKPVHHREHTDACAPHAPLARPAAVLRAGACHMAGCSSRLSLLTLATACGLIH